jgi:hypothetical protein
MAVGRKIIAVFVGVLAIGVTADADMMPVSAVDAPCLAPATVAKQPDLQSTSLSVPFGHPDLADLSSLPSVFPPELGSQADTMRGTPLIRTDEQDSLGLCLFALLGLGLCKSAPYVKKFSFGTVPDWYHTGGPFQVGHSHAISPDCLYQAPVHCFIQPESPRKDPMPRYRQEAIMCLWRTSQFTPAVLASRAPPFDAHSRLGRCV